MYPVNDGGLGTVDLTNPQIEELLD